MKQNAIENSKGIFDCFLIHKKKDDVYGLSYYHLTLQYSIVNKSLYCLHITRLPSNLMYLILIFPSSTHIFVPELALAIEYNGEYHYHHVGVYPFHV